MNTTLTNDQITAGAAVMAWTPVTKPGQVRVGDKLRFTIGDKHYSQRAKLILHAGMEDEEVIYDKGRNFYFITKCVLSGFSNHKNVEVLQATAPSPQIAEKVELPPLPASFEDASRKNPRGRVVVPIADLKASFEAYAREAIAASRRAAGGELVELLRAIRPNYGAVGSRDVDVTAQRNRIDRAIELLSAAPASAGQAGQVAAHMEPVGRVKDRFAGTDKAYRTVIWADRTFAMDVPDGAYLYAAPITERAAAPASGDISQSAPMASAIQGEKAAATSAGELPAEWQQVMDEVARATRKFPTWPTDPLHAVAVLGEEFGELTKAVLQTTYEPHKVQPGELRTEAIQTAAMSLRFLASLGRYEFAPSPQHNQDATHQPSAQKGGA